MGHNSVVSGHPKSTRIPQGDGLSTRPPDLGCHPYSVIDMLHVTCSVHVGMKWHAMTFALHLCMGHHVKSGVSAWLG